ncbi:SHOCT domain-containing protein [Salinigranum sp. GCM10025319]|uniref:SHOCT domain-containing protein n=1 Tax=Salinigranum sp. GCM10025319 TaxID=3252687 RepID=UPI00361BB75A
MFPSRPRSGRRNRATGVASLLVLGVGLTALFLGYGWFWIVFVVGFAVFVPLVSTLFDEDGTLDETDEALDSIDRTLDGDSLSEATTDDDPLATLRDRYARGELTDEQFERKLEALLETETIEAVEDRARRRTDAGEGERDGDTGCVRSADDTERETTRETG